MVHFDWDTEKNKKLLAERGVDFEKVIIAMQDSGMLDDFPHPNTKQYPNQRIFIVIINQYAYLVPYVEHENIIFLKTIIP